MKQLVFIIGGFFLFFSCQNNTQNNASKEEVMTLDSLPDAEWNGEYMKIESPDEPNIKTKSRGSEIYNLGKVELSIDDREFTFITFIRNKNILSFNKNSITAFITNGRSEQIQLSFNKEQIQSKYKGQYTTSSNPSFSMLVEVREEGKNKEYTLKNGAAEIVKFSPQAGTFVVDFKGTFVDKDNEKHTGQGKIKMKFENVAMTAVPVES